MPRETFQWQHICFDVTNINEDIASGRLSAVSTSIPRHIVDWYAVNVLGLSGGTKLLPQMATINLEHARGLSEERRKQPVVLIRFPPILPNDPLSIPLPGALCVDPSTGEVVVPQGRLGDVVALDGNHRIAAAHMSAQKEVRALYLALEQLERQRKRYLGY